ncbi:VanZ family protein [Paenibacillus koleovorans]|uniref:VanZ family protein n=1 Tax=Paenibacillus koleovorans TaxID=121608 RepID=UPI000FD775EF
MKPIVAKRGLLIVMLLIWICGIFAFSSQPYKQQNFKPFLSHYIDEDQVSRFIPAIEIHYSNTNISAKQSPLLFIEYVVRKLAHLLLYAGLAMLLYFVLTRWRIKNQWSVILSLLFVAIIGAMDEWNQGFRIGRNESWVDVGIDLCGGVLGLAAVWIRAIIVMWRNRGSK